MQGYFFKNRLRLLISGVAASFLATMPAAFGQTTNSTTAADSRPSVSVLLTRQNERTRVLEEGLRELRGNLDTDMRALKMQITQLSNNASSDETTTSAEIRDLRDQIERLADAVAMASRRMERTLEVTSDMEFRLLRMEKRLQTLMNFGGEELASAAVQEDTIAAGDSSDVTMSRDAETGEVTWQVSEDKLNAQLAAADAAGAIDGDAAAAAHNTSDTPVADPNANGETLAVAVPAGPEILPEGNPEEQYSFALGKAMQNELETAEAAFTEFRAINPGDEREADALFWLGRIQYLRKEYERAAITFSEFSRIYPDDARIGDTTLLIAESVSKFAPTEQACAIYRELPNLVAAPTDQFTAKLAALSEAASCGN